MAEPRATELCIRLLGPPEVFYRGRQLAPFPTRKCALLLAYLVVNRHAHERNRLAGTLWPDLPDARARRSLSTELWRLRQCLGPAAAAIATDATTVQFAPPFACWVDVEEWSRPANKLSVEQLAAAVEQYRGDFLAGYFDDWVLVERERLRERHLDGLARLMAHYGRQGDHAQAADVARRILALDPLREEIHRELMRLYAALGDRVAAVRQYHQLAAMLAQEIGLPPMPATTALYSQVLGEPDQRSIPQPTQMPHGAVFVGRAAELASLEQALAGQGPGIVIAIGGEAGAGKTSLVERWLATIGARAAVLTGRCRESKDTYPYQPIVEALREGLKHPLLHRLLAIADTLLSELGTLLPEIHASRPGLPDNPALPPAQARERLWLAVATALEAMATPRQPLVLFLDDAHRADPSTLDLLAYVARYLREKPFLLLITYRSEAVDPDSGRPLARWLASLADDPHRFLSLSLPALSLPETSEMLWRLAGTKQPPTRFAERLYWDTGGNPLFVIETLRALFEVGHLVVYADGRWGIPLDRQPDELFQVPLATSVREIIQVRLARLGEHLRDYITLAAVIGRQFDFELLLASSGQDAARTLDAVTGLRQLGLIRDVPGGACFDFQHDKVREVIYQALNSTQRAFLHRRVAQALETKAACDPEASVGSLAHHFACSDQPHKAVRYLLEAGDRAAQVYACHVAVARYDQALAIGTSLQTMTAADRFDLLMRRYHCQWVLGAHEALLPTLDAAVALARACLGEKRLGQALLAQGTNLVSLGRWIAARPLLEEALSTAQRAGDRATEGLVRLELADLFSHVQQPESMRDHYHSALAIARDLDDDTLGGRARLGLALVEHRPAERVRVHLEVLDRALAAGNWRLITTLSSEVVSQLLTAGRPGDALHRGEQLLELARSQGLSSVEAILCRALAQVRHEVGDYETARSLALASLHSCGRRGYAYGELRAQVCLALAERGLGYQDDAAQRMEKAMAVCQKMGARRDLAAFQYAAAGAWLWQPEPRALARARGWAQASLAAARELGFRRAETIALACLAEIAVRSGERQAALAASRQAIALLEARGHAVGYEPLVCFAHYRALRAHDDPAAPLYLERARALLAGRAYNLADRGLRRSYLFRVPLHRQILRMPD